MIIMISYDLNNHEKPEAYQDVADMIKKYAKDHRKPLMSQWFVETDDSVSDWHDRMKSVTDDDDHWFIVQIKHPYTGWQSRSGNGCVHGSNRINVASVVNNTCYFSIPKWCIV